MILIRSFNLQFQSYMKYDSWSVKPEPANISQGQAPEVVTTVAKPCEVEKLQVHSNGQDEL